MITWAADVVILNKDLLRWGWGQIKVRTRLAISLCIRRTAALVPINTEETTSPSQSFLAVEASKHAASSRKDTWSCLSTMGIERCGRGAKRMSNVTGFCNCTSGNWCRVCSESVERFLARSIGYRLGGTTLSGRLFGVSIYFRDQSRRHEGGRKRFDCLVVLRSCKRAVLLGNIVKSKWSKRSRG